MGPLLDAGPHWHHQPSGHRSPGVAIIRAAARDCGWLGASPALLYSVPPQVALQLPEGPLWRSEGQVLVWACVGARRADCLLRAVWTVCSRFVISAVQASEVVGGLLVNIPARARTYGVQSPNARPGPAPVIPPGRHGGSLQTVSSVFLQEHRVLSRGPLPLLTQAQSCGPPHTRHCSLPCTLQAALMNEECVFSCHRSQEAGVPCGS